MTPIDITKFEQIKASNDLPSPKGVALAIIQMSQSDDVSIPELAHVIKSDPAFVGRLLKSANSANTYGRRPSVSVHDALVVLGLPAVRGLALGFSLVSEYGSGRCRAFDYQAYWSASLVCAIAMQALTTRTRAAMPEEAFSVGLLARVGELALATLHPEHYADTLERHRAAEDSSLKDLEAEAFGVNHSELSAAMLADWGLPKLFSEPVYLHEEPDQAGFLEGSRHDVLVHSLALSRYLAAVCMAQENHRSVMMPKLYRLGTHLSIDSEVLNALCDKVIHDWHDWGQLLGVRTQPLPPFEALARPALELSRPKETPGSESALPRIRVLIVDDDAVLRTMLRTVLERLGNEVIEAKDGQEGLQMALDTQPHMMIVDWVMPGMDGMQLTRALRRAKMSRGIFIMLLTSFEDDERLIEAYETGVDDYMAKPLKPRVLVARLRAGQRVIKLQQEIERDREEIRHFAAELAVTNRRLQEVALTDALTDLPNRRFAMERIHQEWAAASRSHRPLSCMVIDIDGFKHINDAYGHDIGDQVLRQTALTLKGALRSQDVLCRIGGDEFLVICPDTPLDAALSCAERIRRTAEATPIKTALVQTKSTVSVGVAQRDASMPDIGALIKRADQGVYTAKHGGRNRAAAAPSTTH